MQDSVVEDLKLQVVSRRVVLVVGSGVSLAATANAPSASWTGLLRLGVQRCVSLDPSLAGEWEKRALADVTSGGLDDLLVGASKVARPLRRGGEWPRWLADTIGKLEATEPALLDALGRLDAPIVTTNYDDLIERRLHRFPITLRDRTEQISFVRGESRDTVLHVHGHWRSPDSVVLDLADYERVVGDALAQASLRTMGEASSLIFVGCGDGLADPNFDQFLEWIGTVLKDSRHRHFRLEREAEASRRQAWHDARGHRVRVISYGERHQDLVPFLAQLEPTPVCPGGPTEIIDAPPSSSLARPVLAPGEYVRLQEKGRHAIEKLAALAKPLGFTSVASHAAEILKMLEQDLYRVAITGRSRAGKSTLINALIQRAICPVERVITTAIPIIIGPGTTEGACVTFEGNARPPLHLDGPITSDMIAPYADQRYNHDNAKNVERIEISLGHGVLDLGVEYVDIPGFDDPSGKIWSAANEAIRAAHALVLVLDVSTYDSGGFALDRATRDVLQAALERGSPVLVVCNKADKLAPPDRVGASRYVTEQLERFGVAKLGPPFFLSACDAAQACGKGEPVPPAMVAFEEALWEQLWASESVGLRRLHRVFEALRVAGEEATSLMRVRSARGPERERLREAIAAAREDLVRIRGNVAGGAEHLCVEAKNAVEAARSAHVRAIADHIDALPQEQTIPTVSAAAEMFREHLTQASSSVLRDLERAQVAHHQGVERAVSRSLSHVRAATGSTAQPQHAIETLEALGRLIGEVEVPHFADGDRTIKVAGAGIGSAAAVGFAFGGPLGWALAGIVGLAVSAVVDHVADKADTLDELKRRLSGLANDVFATFEQNVRDAITRSSEGLGRRVKDRMLPFLDDMEHRLEAIREPTSDELQLHDQVRQITDAALENLVRILEDRVPPAVAPSAPRVP